MRDLDEVYYTSTIPKFCGSNNTVKFHCSILKNKRSSTLNLNKQIRVPCKPTQPNLRMASSPNCL